MTEPPNSDNAENHFELGKAPKTRTFSRYLLPSNRHAFPVHFDVVRRFVTMSRNGAEAVSVGMVEGSGVPAQAASLNARFLVSIGLLARTERGRYVPTPEAIRFVNAKSVSDEKARPILTVLISSVWFAEIAQVALATQPVMSEDQFLGELALAAQTDMGKEGPALRVLLEYLVYAGIVTRDERGLSPGGRAAAPLETGPTSDFATPSTGAIWPLTRTSGGERPIESQGWEVLQTQDFYVKVKSEPDKIDDLVDFLQLLKRKISKSRGTTAPLTDAVEGSASDRQQASE